MDRTVGVVDFQRIWVHANPVPAEVEADLLWHCRSPYEVCGFIDSEWKIHLVRNVSDDPAMNFAMDEYEKAQVLNLIADQGRSVLGIFHSHPNGYSQPSQTDVIGWPDFDWRYFIISSGRVIEWHRL